MLLLSLQFLIKALLTIEKAVEELGGLFMKKSEEL